MRGKPGRYMRHPGSRILLSNFRLQEPVGPVAPAIQHADAAAVGIVENKERLVAQEIHLLHGFQLVHRKYAKSLASGDDWRQLARFVQDDRAFLQLGCRFTGAAPVVVPALVALDLLP